MIPLIDLKKQYENIKSEIDEAIRDVVGSCQFILGERVTAFESDFAAYCQSRYALGMNSGTSALHLALLAAGVGPGDEVLSLPMYPELTNQDVASIADSVRQFCPKSEAVHS